MRRLSTLARRWPLFALAALYLYLLVHIVSGAGGMASWKTYEADSVRLRADLLALEAERARLEAKAARLSSRSLDLDALDVAARRVLYVSRPGELVIPIHD